MTLLDDGRLSVEATNLLVAVLVLGLLTAIVLLTRSLRAEARGAHIHAHADGTVHSHARGARRHAHPTFVERYDERLTKMFGPAPGGPSVQRLNTPDA